MAKITSSDFAKLVEAQKETTRQLMTAEERAADDAKKAEKSRVRSEASKKGHETRLANKNQNAAAENAAEMQNQQGESTGFLGKIANFMGLDRLKGAAEAEDTAKKEKSDKKGNTFLSKIAGGIGGLLKSAKEKVKDAGGSIMDMLKKFAFGAFAVAILAFLQSPYFDKTVKVIKETIIPALTTLIDDYLIPIGKLFWDGILKSIDIFKDLISGLKESFRLFGEGKWIEGTIKFFESIVFYIARALDNAFTFLYNSIAVIFGFEGTDSVGGQIIKFFTDIYDRIVSFFTETVPAYIDGIIFDLESMVDQVVGFGTDIWNEVKNLFGDFSVFKFVEETFGELFSSIKGIFSGDFSLENFKKLFGSIFDIVYYPINLAVNTIKDIFKLGDPDKPFRLSDFIFGPDGVVTKVINFFEDLFDIDFKALLGGLLGKVGKVGSKIAGYFGFGDDKKPAKPDVNSGKPLTKEQEQLLSEDDSKATTPTGKIEYKEKRAERVRPIDVSDVRARQATAEEKAKFGIAPKDTGSRMKPPDHTHQPTTGPIINSPTDARSTSTTNVTQTSKDLTPKDRVIDDLSYAF